MAQCQARVTKQSVTAQPVSIQGTYHWHVTSLLVFVLALVVSQQSHAENSSPTRLVRADIGVINNNPEATQKTWAELTDEQKKVLAPLGAEWDTLRPWQREKMLDIAHDYPKMDAKKQARVQKRLNSWSRMTPYERENARKRYQHFHSLSAEQQDEVRKKWQAHKKQSDEKIDKLQQESNATEYDPDLE